MERSPEISQQFLELVQGVNTTSAVESAKKLEEFLQTKIPGADALGAAARDLLAIYGTADDILLIKILSVCIRRLLEGLENNDSPLASDEMFRAVAKHLVTHGEQDDDFHLKLFELLPERAWLHTSILSSSKTSFRASAQPYPLSYDGSNGFVLYFIVESPIVKSFGFFSVIDKRRHKTRGTMTIPDKILMLPINFFIFT